MLDNIRGFDYDIRSAIEVTGFKMNSIDPDDPNYLLAYELIPPQDIDLDIAVDTIMLLWLYELRYVASEYDSINVTRSDNVAIMEAVTIARSATGCSVRFIIIKNEDKK